MLVAVSINDLARVTELIERQGWAIKAIASELGSGDELCETQVTSGELYFDDSGRLSWRRLIGDRKPKLTVDFKDPGLLYRVKHGGGRQELLARAVGVKHHSVNEPLRVIDATAGLGVDAWIMASLGMEVVMLERVPVMALLLADGLARVAEMTNLKLIFGDANQHVTGLSHDGYQVAYLDPMYPSNSSDHAARNQRLRLVQEAVGQDEDACMLLKSALTSCHRVVVKRPRHAHALANLPPDWQLTGQSCRYDLYFTNKHRLI